jgi:hypothetical protein
VLRPTECLTFGGRRPFLETLFIFLVYKPTTLINFCCSNLKGQLTGTLQALVYNYYCKPIITDEKILYSSVTYKPPYLIGMHVDDTLECKSQSKSALNVTFNYCFWIVWQKVGSLNKESEYAMNRSEVLLHITFGGHQWASTVFLNRLSLCGRLDYQPAFGKVPWTAGNRAHTCVADLIL